MVRASYEPIVAEHEKLLRDLRRQQRKDFLSCAFYFTCAWGILLLTTALAISVEAWTAAAMTGPLGLYYLFASMWKLAGLYVCQRETRAEFARNLSRVEQFSCWLSWMPEGSTAVYLH